VKDRFNGKGVHDSDPHFQVPPQLHHQLHRENYRTVSRGDLPDAHSIFEGGQQQNPSAYYVTRRLGETPVPREVEKQCFISGSCTVWQDAWQQDWSMPNVTYEVVHCYKILREPLISGGKRDGYLKKYNSSGHEIWAVRMGGHENDDLRAVTTDRWGNLFVAGNFFSSEISFDSKVLKQMVDTRGIHLLSPKNLTNPSSRIRKLLVAKYNSGGEFIMSAEVGSCFQETCDILSVDADDFGNTFVTGSFINSITFGSMCHSVTCNTTIQSDKAHKTTMDLTRINPECKPLFSGDCPKVPIVKMQSITRCSNREYSGKGYKCIGDVFVAMLNPQGMLLWVENINSRNLFMQQSNLKEVDRRVHEAWANRAYWAYFDRGILRLGMKHSHVRSQFWPPGGIYNSSDTTRYWWAVRNSSHPVVPGLGSTNEWGDVCSGNKCQTRVPPSQNPGGLETRSTASYGDSFQRS